MRKKHKTFSFDKSHLDINPEARDFSKTQKDYAVFLPSISAIYAKIVSMKEYKMRDSMPAGLPNGLKDLDFLDPSNSLFYYPTALYSAGHAVLDPNDSFEQERMVQQRDRKNTLIVGDSGGYQAATGVLKFPWKQKPNQSDADFMRDKDALRMQILRWLEATADYSMVLDWPTSALLKFGIDPVTGICSHPGLKNFNDCLTGSLENHNFFIKHRKEGATKFINVLQGRTQEEGDIWWEAVKDLPFESWAFSNVQASNFGIHLRRLLIMRDNNYLQGSELLHYLGNGKIKMGCALTTLQRSLRKYVDPNLILTFDAASPFIMTAKGQCYYGFEHSSHNVGFKGGPMPDDTELKNNPQLLNEWLAENLPKKCDPIPSKIGNRITVGDICVRGKDDLQYKKVPWAKAEMYTPEYLAAKKSKKGRDPESSEWPAELMYTGNYLSSPEYAAEDTFKWSKAYKEYLQHHTENNGLFEFEGNKFDNDESKYQIKWPSSMDGFSYLLAMNHNVELHINAIQAANEIMDSPIDNAKKYLTSDLLEFKDLCPEIFKSECPMDLINKHAKMLQQISGMDGNNDISKNFEDI